MDCVALGSHYASWPLEPLAGAARRGAPPRRPGSDLSRARPAPTRNRPPRPRAVAGPAPVPGPVVPARPGPRARRVTRENVPRPASTSLNPRARLLEVRARGLSDVLADDQTRPRPNLADDHHAVNAPTNHHAPTSLAPHHTAPRSRTAVSGENGSASGCKSDAYHRK